MSLKWWQSCLRNLGGEMQAAFLSWQWSEMSAFPWIKLELLICLGQLTSEDHHRAVQLPSHEPFCPFMCFSNGQLCQPPGIPGVWWFPETRWATRKNAVELQPEDFFQNILSIPAQYKLDLAAEIHMWSDPKISSVQTLGMEVPPCYLLLFSLCCHPLYFSSGNTVAAHGLSPPA